MAVTEIIPIISYVSGGASGNTYPIPFTLLSSEHLKFYIDGEESSAAKIITGVDSGSVSVTIPDAYPIGAMLTFLSLTPYAQETVFNEGERQPGKRIEQGLDNVVIQIQQLARESQQSPKAAPGANPPGGSYNRAPDTSTGQDENGNIVHRSVPEDIARLGIASEIASAQSSAETASLKAAQASEASILAQQAENSTTGTLALINALFVEDSTADHTFFESSPVNGEIRIAGIPYYFSSTPLSPPSQAIRRNGGSHLFTSTEAALALASIVSNGEDGSYNTTSVGFYQANPQVSATANGLVTTINRRSGSSGDVSLSSDMGTWSGLELQPNLAVLPSVFLRANSRPLRLRASI